MTQTIEMVGHDLDHFSNSQHSSYLRCPHCYFLERVAHAPKIPAWWFLGGTCVHLASEEVDHALLSHALGVTVTQERVTEILDELVEKEMVEKNLSTTDGWFAAGRHPNKNGYDWWRENAPLMVQRYEAWRKVTQWPIEFFKPFDGLAIPAIEFQVNAQYRFGLFTGSIDRVFRLPNGDLVVADIKTGQPPKEPLQLGDYANALEMMGYERPKWGTYILLKTGEHTGLVPLDKYTTPYLESIHEQVVVPIRAGAFAPNLGDNCRTCVVQEACYPFGGSDSALYDPLNPNYKGAV